MQNIVENEKLHLTSLNSDSISQVFFAHPREEGRLFRPIAYFSFALNWYLGAVNVVGYHFINILLHWGTAVLLYLTTIQLLETPVLQRSARSKHLIALLATLLWAVNPIQTQAVTYIVQRMTELAALFSLASILCYLLGRRATVKSKQRLWFLAALVSFILALGSKENSITLPVVLLLIEMIFFRSLVRVTRKHLLIGAGVLCLAGTAIYILTNGNSIGSIFGYDHRNFTLWQRMLTESRIMVFYLSLLIFPAPFRFSLDHDIVLSTTLLQPPTTLLSVIFLFALTVWTLWKYKSLPILAFAILFFLLNHLIESTVFPLELIFEHRNYLPSLFLFFPVAVWLVDCYGSERLRAAPFARYAFAGAIALLICALATATYSRNAVWKTEQSLWEDSLSKAPGQSRPYINLAVAYQKQGKNDEAFELCRQSLTKESATPTKDRMRAYNNMGNIAMDRKAYADAVGYYRNAFDAYENEQSRYFLHKALLADGQFDAAQKELENLIHDNPGDDELAISMAIVLATKKDYVQAAALLRTVLDKTEAASYLRGSALTCLGSIFSRQGDYQDAEQQFREALSSSEPRVVLLCLIGNHIRRGNQEAAIAQIKELGKHYTVENLVEVVHSANRQNTLFPVESATLTKLIRFTLASAPTTDGHSL